jgi:hypothetical protein
MVIESRFNNYQTFGELFNPIVDFLSYLRSINPTQYGDRTLEIESLVETIEPLVEQLRWYTIGLLYMSRV